MHITCILVSHNLYTSHNSSHTQTIKGNAPFMPTKTFTLKVPYLIVHLIIHSCTVEYSYTIATHLTEGDPQGISRRLFNGGILWLNKIPVIWQHRNYILQPYNRGRLVCSWCMHGCMGGTTLVQGMHDPNTLKLFCKQIAGCWMGVGIGWWS